MVRKKYDWIDDMQKSIVGNTISKMFFVSATHSTEVTNKLYIDPRNKQHIKGHSQKPSRFFKQVTRPYPAVLDRYNLWKSKGFIDHFSLKEKIRRYDKYHEERNDYWRLNLNFFYEYCKEKRNIEFTNQEKEILNKMFDPAIIRNQIVTENFYDSLFNAILKYYVKHYFMREYIPKYFLRNYKAKLQKIVKEKGKKAIEYNPIGNLAIYLAWKKKNPSIVLGLDEKMLKTLGICP